MTVLEALKAAIQIQHNISADSFSLALINAGLNGSDTYDLSKKDLVNSAAVSILQSLPVQSISEGGFSVTYDKDAIEKNIAILTGTLGKRGVQRLVI